MRRRAALGAVLAVALAVRLANLGAMSRLPVADYQRDWAESDMETAWRWSGSILAGDVLGRDTVHQYTEWMRAMAPLETWERWWGGRGVFHQAPLYAYVLALMRLVVGDGFLGIGLCQLGLGLLNVVLVFLLTERIFDRPAAVLAGLGTALYGPFLFHETLLLRDTLAVTCSLLLLSALLRAPDARGPAGWLLAGVAFALALLARETTALFAPLAFLWMVQRLGRTPRRLAGATAAVLAGALLGLAPLIARNLAVGVAPWALSTRGLETFIHGHAAGATAAGVRLPPATAAILEQADGSLLATVRLTLATYDGDWSRLVAHEVTKLAAIVSRYEAMDNVNWYYFADRVPTLAWSLRFELVLALGVAGLLVPGRRADDRPLRYFLLASSAALMFGAMIGRYRLVPIAALLPYAGAGTAFLGSALLARRWRAAAVPAAVTLGVLLLSATALSAVEARERYRHGEFLLAARTYYERGARARAFDELRAGLAAAYRGPDQPRLPAGWAGLLRPLLVVGHETGRDAETAATLEQLARDYPADPDVHAHLAVVYTGLGMPERAAEHAAAERRLRGP